MGLNKVKPNSNMYQGWITHTWNTIKGACPHNCSYCYMKKWGDLRSARFDEKELKTDLGSGNFIFIGSSCDMFAKDIPHEWVIKTIRHCEQYNNRYLFQTKNPGGFKIMESFSIFNILCVTLETNRHYQHIMNSSPKPVDRALQFKDIGGIKYITIEPIMDFDMKEFVELIKMCGAVQVNIGADSGGNKLPEPSSEKIFELISELEKFTIVKQKKNLNRLL